MYTNFSPIKTIQYKILVYGGLGHLATTRILPALRLLKKEFNIELALVDLKDIKIYNNDVRYYQYNKEPLADYDIAIVATPNNTHLPVILKLLDGGLHVLCEKPIAHTLQAAQEILDASKRHPELVCMLSDHYVYKPAVRDIIRNWKVYQGQTGEIDSIVARIFEQSLPEGREWLFYRDDSGGGVAIDTGYHIVSVLGKLFGYNNIVLSKARISRYSGAPGDAETYASIELSAAGVPVVIEVGKWMPNVQKEIIFFGKQSVLKADLQKGQTIINDKVVKEFDIDDSYASLDREFLQSVIEQRLPWTTFEEGFEALKIIQESYAMAKWIDCA